LPAHRLSTIQQADRIIVMAAGKVVDQGTYQELYERPGPFRELVQRQEA
jgi:ATP-binding cassette subfamily B protein